MSQQKEAKRTQLTESEWASGELLITPNDKGATIWFLRGTYVSSVGNLYRACCIIESYNSMDMAVKVAEQLDMGIRMSPDPAPARKWKPATKLKKGKTNAKKSTARRSCLRSISHV